MSFLQFMYFRISRSELESNIKAGSLDGCFVA